MLMLLAALWTLLLYPGVTTLGGANVQGTLHRRTYFYVGQSYAPQGNSSIAFGQMYVEHLIPAEVTQRYPLLFIHGNGKQRIMTIAKALYLLVVLRDDWHELFEHS